MAFQQTSESEIRVAETLKFATLVQSYVHQNPADPVPYPAGKYLLVGSIWGQEGYRTALVGCKNQYKRVLVDGNDGVEEYKPVRIVTYTLLCEHCGALIEVPYMTKRQLAATSWCCTPPPDPKPEPNKQRVRRVPITLTMDPAVLDVIDTAARARGLSRGEFIESIYKERK